MPRYMSLVSFTDEGFKNLKDTVKRASAFAERAKKNQIEMEQTYWSIGQYDLVHVFTAPNDEAAAAAALALGSQGHVRTVTIRLFDKQEVTSILADAYEMRVEQGSVK